MRAGRLSTNIQISLILFLLGVWADGSGGLKHRDAFASDSTQTSAIDGISITPDNQILVELMPEDTTPANLFDLNGRTLVFTPDGQGGYSRQVQALAWEENIGETVADEAVIQLASFRFDFAGHRWGSFHVSRHGLLTFGAPFTYSYYDSENRFDTMSEIAGNFATTPTISPLYKPMLGGRADYYGATQHVTHWPDRVVVTWITTEPDYYMYGVPPEKPARFQAVLRADGSIEFNYIDVTFGDGIVGLFPNEEVTKGDLIASVVDGKNSGLPGHLDLLEVAVYATNTDAVIFEITTRAPHTRAQFYHIHFDTDRPYWTDYGHEDLDFSWGIDVYADGEYFVWHSGVHRVKLLASDGSNRLALLADIRDPQGLSASVIAGVGAIDGNWKFSDTSSPTRIELPSAPHVRVDLSQSHSRFSQRQHEVFHYRSAPDSEEIACRIIDVLGDRFDLFVFHNEFRIDSQESGTPVRPHYGNARAEGTGIPWNFGVPCGEGRLKAVWELPVWMKSDHVINRNRYHDERARFDRGLLLFAHEFMHAWTAHASYKRNGQREPLPGNYCRCHWRPDLHIPAAFPWHEEEAGPRSLMGGRYWRENGDGTFTPIDGYHGGGHSWLDLYMMGVADASEVPDMFILRNLQALTEGNGEDGYWGGVFTGDKESISIEQIIAAEGPRKPSVTRSQKVFNAGFVYLLEPGKTPTADLLDLHAEYRDKVVEHWSHITGGRSHITTKVNGMVEARLENPAPASFQSGISVISGWACQAQEIVIELNGVPLSATYGTEREPAVEQVCGHSDAGFSLLWNWNNLGAGTHTVRALVDGVEFANTTVQVTTFGEQFLRGESGRFNLPNFPTAGETIVVQWEESLQNFVITDGQPNPGGGYNQVAGVNARLENPSLGSAQSGISAISGWACEAEEIVIELNGVPLSATYGTEREPAVEQICGHSDAGFGLLWNWNNLGAGTHTVRALVDGVEFANTTVRVTTFGEPFRWGLSGTFPIPDFPRSGENKRLRWAESLQNFVIIP